jgi:hypothetical protein
MVVVVVVVLVVLFHGAMGLMHPATLSLLRVTPPTTQLSLLKASCTTISEPVKVIGTAAVEVV